MTTWAFSLPMPSPTVQSNSILSKRITNPSDKRHHRHYRTRSPLHHISFQIQANSTLLSPTLKPNDVSNQTLDHPPNLHSDSMKRFARRKNRRKNQSHYPNTNKQKNNSESSHHLVDQLMVIQEKSNTSSFTTYDFNIRLKQLAHKKNSISQCLQLYNQMQQNNLKPDKYTYSTLLTSCLKSKAFDVAFDLYQDLQREGVQLDHYLRGNLLSVAAATSPPKIDLCLYLFQSAEKPNLVMCNIMIDAFARSARLDDAINTFRYMTGKGIAPDAYTVSALTKAYVKSGQLENALQKLKEMHSAGLEIPSAAFGQLIDAYGKLAKMDDAMKVFDTMTLYGVLPTQITFNILIGACAHSAMKKRAFEIFEEMRHTSLFHGDRYTYHSLMKCCLHDADCEQVLKLYRAIQTGPFQCNQVSYRYALQAAAFLFDLDFVLQVAEDMKLKGSKLREDTAAMLVAATIRCSDLESTSSFSAEYIRLQKNTQSVVSFFQSIRNCLYIIEQYDESKSLDYLQTSLVVDEIERNWSQSIKS